MVFIGKNRKSGQSLIEILVAIALGMVLLGVAIAIIAPVLRANTRTNEARVATALGRELLENLKVFIDNDWDGVASLSTSSAYHYHLTTSTQAFFSILSGDDLIVFSSTTYSRHFYIDDVCRDINFKIPSNPTNCVYDDATTKKVTVSYTWLPDGADYSFATYITKIRSSSIVQDDWSKGSGDWGPFSTTSLGYVAATNTVASSSGVLKIFSIIEDVQ